MIAEAIINAASILVRWIPIRFAMVHVYENGVRFWFGKDTKLLTKPGMYAYIPWVSDIVTESVVPQEVETNEQCITDDKHMARTFTIGMQYEVPDLRAKLTKVDDFNDSFLNLVERVAAKVMRGSDTKELDNKILGMVRTQASKWGVKVNYLGILNDVRSRPIHLFLSREGVE
jgi:regulator of protease activity HflC (stomatin/prohibitin superfamily)